MRKMTVKLLKDPLRTTVRGIRSQLGAKLVVRQIQEKICDYGVCSDREMEYLREHTDWDRLNPRTESNFG